MTANSVWGVMFLGIVCPLIGGLPLSGWITRFFASKNLSELGTRNIGVSAAFYHGGTWVGLLAVLAEAAKGIGVVWGARQWLPADPTWELVALLALVAGRFWLGRGAGTTNVAWGIAAYHWEIAGLTLLLSVGSQAFGRDRKLRRLATLILLPMVIALWRQDLSETVVAIAISGLLGWIYTQLPDDLDLVAHQAQPDSQGVFQILQGQSNLTALDQPLLASKVGQKATNLSQLKRWGYPVPMGWVLQPGEDAEPLIQALNPTTENPLVVRSSAIGEDSEQASAAGQYQTFLQVTSRIKLREAIAQCQDCYDDPAAAQYRQHQGVPEAGMAVIVQVQIQGQFSGVAFSRDPMSGDSDGVAIEALPGPATQVVSGQVTPERYLVSIQNQEQEQPKSELKIKGEPGQVPPRLIRQVAVWVREIESRYHGIPQDMEWTYDGKTLWVLQTRPITTLTPIWTRRIAAEVIPGVIRPLTWSINNPLTCGVWADLFRQILGQRSNSFSAHELATLHYGHAYFNATLMGQLFQQMGLPAESLEFLTRGASMGRPSPVSMIKTLPGLLRLVSQELTLNRSFCQENKTSFTPLLSLVLAKPARQLSSEECLDRIDQLLTVLRRVTFFSILAPLSVAVRQKLWKVDDTALDTSVLPETAAVRSLHEIIARYPETIARENYPADLGEEIDEFLKQYGYLSDVATDISIPTWSEDPQPVWALLTSFGENHLESSPNPTSFKRQHLGARILQRRLLLKGQVAQVYSRLLAELRYTVLALEQKGISQGIFLKQGDIFFLKLSEIREWITQSTPTLQTQLSKRIKERRHEFDLSQQLKGVPTVVYGTPPPLSILQDPVAATDVAYYGIGASPGVVEGTVRVMRSLRQIPPNLSRQTILVVPYTDAGWSPVLAQVGAIVAEVGGRLSHGAIVAREYGIPAVMDISQATQRLKDGQRVKVDGYRGIIEVL
jgi:phosphohistidine swiveling domain-containing protein/glycerol-3-phosphate acyltransferase PlsY